MNNFCGTWIGPPVEPRKSPRRLLSASSTTPRYTDIAKRGGSRPSRTERRLSWPPHMAMHRAQRCWRRTSSFVNGGVICANGNNPRILGMLSGNPDPRSGSSMKRLAAGNLVQERGQQLSIIEFSNQDLRALQLAILRDASEILRYRHRN